MGGRKVKQRPRGLKVEISNLPTRYAQDEIEIGVIGSPAGNYRLCVPHAKQLGIPIPEMSETIETTMRVVLSNTRRKR